jgi:hypothetical protein
MIFIYHAIRVICPAEMAHGLVCAGIPFCTWFYQCFLGYGGPHLYNSPNIIINTLSLLAQKFQDCLYCPLTMLTVMNTQTYMYIFVSIVMSKMLDYIL